MEASREDASAWLRARALWVVVAMAGVGCGAATRPTVVNDDPVTQARTARRDVLRDVFLRGAPAAAGGTARVALTVEGLDACTAEAIRRTSGIELQPSTLLAIAHGMFGQIVFATACVIAVVTSAAWRDATPAQGIPDAARVRSLPIVLVGALLVQLFLGASYRHLQIPPHDGNAAVHPAWPIWGHVAGAFVILVLSVITGAICSSRAREIPIVRILGKGMIHAIGLQFALGIAALVVVLIRVDAAIPAYEVIVTSAHQATGALILAMAAMLAVSSRRFVAR